MVHSLFYSLSRPPRHFAAYGSPNKYRPVKNCNASTNTAERPSLFVYLCWATATPFTMTTAVKAIDSQRCVSRIHLFHFNATSSELRLFAGRSSYTETIRTLRKDTDPNGSILRVREGGQGCNQSEPKWQPTACYCGAENARRSKTVWIELIFPSLT